MVPRLTTEVSTEDINNKIEIEIKKSPSDNKKNFEEKTCQNCSEYNVLIEIYLLTKSI